MSARTPRPWLDDGDVQLYHGDAREIMPALYGPGSVDLVFTDPPYGHNNNNGDLAHRREAALGILPPGADAQAARPIANDGPMEAAGLAKWLFAESRRVLRPGCCCCCCCCCCGGGGGPDPQFARWSLWMDAELSFKQMVVWDKGGLGMGWHYRRSYEVVLVGEKPGAACNWHGGSDVSNVVRVNGLKPGEHDHPTPKPPGLASRFIQWHTAPGELVVDPFLGGGSTGVAARALGRRFVGIDVEERWLTLAAERLSQQSLFSPTIAKAVAP